VTPFSRFRSQPSGNTDQGSARYTQTVMSRCKQSMQRVKLGTRMTCPHTLWF